MGTSVFGGSNSVPTKVCELFPKLSEEGIAIDITSSEDEEAGELGAPFTEPEHEEEWVAWLGQLVGCRRTDGRCGWLVVVSAR